MREIKFRVWDEDLKKFLDPKTGGLSTACFDFEGRPICIYSRDPFIYKFQEFTGLYDDKKNPIYEGDIIKHRYQQDCYAGPIFTEQNPVIFKDGCFFFGDFPLCYIWGNSCLSVEVIGNIFENPELLKNNEIN